MNSNIATEDGLLRAAASRALTSQTASQTAASNLLTSTRPPDRSEKRSPSPERVIFSPPLTIQEWSFGKMLALNEHVISHRLTNGSAFPSLVLALQVVVVVRVQEFQTTTIHHLVEQGRIREARDAVGRRMRSGWQDALRLPEITRSPATGEIGDASENLRWINANRSRFAGQWVALKKGALVASGATRKALDRSLKEVRFHASLTILKFD